MHPIERAARNPKMGIISPRDAEFGVKNVIFPKNTKTKNGNLSKNDETQKTEGESQNAKSGGAAWGPQNEWRRECGRDCQSLGA